MLSSHVDTDLSPQTDSPAGRTATGLARRPKIFSHIDGLMLLALSVVVAVLRWPYFGKPMSPDEGGYLLVGSQWSAGASLYGNFWVDRPPGLMMIFEVAARAGGLVPLRLIGMSAAIISVVLSGLVGRL